MTPSLLAIASLIFLVLGTKKQIQKMGFRYYSAKDLA
jgi:hypothetical protein